MSSEISYPLVSGRVMRGTAVDSCGVPKYGDAAQIASEGFVSIAVAPNYDSGTEITVRNAAGRRCVQRAAEPELINLGLTITFCDVDPDFYTLATGMPVIRDESGAAIGYRTNRGIRPSDVRWALEVWMDAFAESGCDDNGDIPYGYILWPFLTGGQVGDYTIENNAVTFVVNNVLTKDGSGWGEGPYLVATDAMGAAQALYDAIDNLDHEVKFRTTVAPPAATNGLIPLDNPDSADATGATAGSPGVWTPSGDVRPETFADLTGGSFTASPTTAWTTGQHVILGNGTYAHWAGTTLHWVAGKA